MRTMIVVLAIVAVMPASGQTRTQVVLLGTGTPRPEPEHSGPATAVVVNGTAYLVDVGPGIVRRAQAAFEKGVAALAPPTSCGRHSSRTCIRITPVGYPDLIFTTWVQGRSGALRVFGPEGLEDMTRHIMAAWQADIDIRTKGMERRTTQGLTVEAHDVKPGVVFQDANVTVTAFQNAHGEWRQTYGYQFKTADRTVVISGDTNPSDALIQHCQKCDVLIHEAYADAYRPAAVPDWLRYTAKYHTTTSQLAEIANKTQPGLLIMYHRVLGPRGAEISDAQYLADIARTYRGKVVVGQDLDIY